MSCKGSSLGSQAWGSGAKEANSRKEGVLLLARNEPLLEHVLVVAVAPGSQRHYAPAEGPIRGVNIKGRQPIHPPIHVHQLLHHVYGPLPASTLPCSTAGQSSASGHDNAMKHTAL